MLNDYIHLLQGTSPWSHVAYHCVLKLLVALDTMGGKPCQKSLTFQGHPK